MIPAWPLTLLVSAWFMFIAPLLSGPFLLVDRFELKGVSNQVRAANGVIDRVSVRAMLGVARQV